MAAKAHSRSFDRKMKTYFWGKTMLCFLAPWFLLQSMVHSSTSYFVKARSCVIEYEKRVPEKNVEFKMLLRVN